LGSQSHHGYVSRSPPIIPDGQISRVRFETSAICRGPSQKRERFKNAGSYTPLPSLVYPRPRLPAGMWRCAGFIKPAAHTGEETAKCPEPLCPTSVLPPLGRRVLISSESVTPRSSLLRAHVPLPLGSLLLQHLASFGESLQVVPSPCCPWEFPDVISENLSLDAGSRTPAVPLRALTCFFRSVIGLLPGKMGSASRFAPQDDFSRPVFRGCRYSVMFRPPSLFTPQIVPTAAHTAAGQPGLLRPGLSCFVTSARTRYTNRPNTGN
jgi:hypothetical protein